LDLSNLEHLWGSEARLAQQVEKFFTRRGYRVRLAVADTLGAAWALAHFKGESASADGQRAGASSPSPPAIPSLPVEALRIAADTAATLRQLGVEAIGQVMALPREELASRFGDELLRRVDQLTGAAREVIVPHRPPAAFEISRALEEPTADRAALAHVLEELAGKLSRQLAARDQGAVLLVCLLRCVGSNTAPGNTVPLRIGLLQPSANARQLMELIDLHLETVRLADEVDRVELRVAVAGRLGERQGQLFADRWPSDPHQIAVLVNRLSSRLGYEQVLRAELRSSPVPERAVRWLPTTRCKVGERGRGGDGKKSSSRSSTRLPFSPSPCLPLLLHPAPQPLEVVCIAPDGPPQFVWIEKRREQIVHCAGPERIETLWWRGPSVRRDYYRVAVESGSHLWIFRRLADRRWFLHGAFT
jgi:protein ImuB